MNRKQQIIAAFHRERARQRQLMADDDRFQGGTFFQLPNGAWFQAPRTWGGAPEGEHALAAWERAKRRVGWRAQFEADMKATRKRQKAARKGWKTRRANQFA